MPSSRPRPPSEFAATYPRATPVFSDAVRLNVALSGVEPPVWRRVQVPASFTLRRLHAVLQEAFGWTGLHRHRFRAFDRLYGMPAGESDEMRDSRWITLKDLIGEGLRDFVYEYGNRSRWMHQLRIETLIDGDSANQRALCVDGAGACPPEDCGGPDAYARLRESGEAAAGATAFDPVRVNARLGALR